MWNNLNKEQEKFVRETMNKASKLGLSCTLILSYGNISDGYISFSTDGDIDEVNSHLTSMLKIHNYDKVEKSDLQKLLSSKDPSFVDLIYYGMHAHKDVKGWINLFNEENEMTDGRWYIKVDPITEEIQFHRYEDLSLKYIACIDYSMKNGHHDSVLIKRIWKAIGDVNSYLSVYINITTKIKDVQDNVWTDCLGDYGLLIRNVMIDVMTSQNLGHLSVNG